MTKTASDVIVETLLEWDVDTIFGIPGDGRISAPDATCRIMPAAASRAACLNRLGKKSNKPRTFSTKANE